MMSKGRNEEKRELYRVLRTMDEIDTPRIPRERGKLSEYLQAVAFVQNYAKNIEKKHCNGLNLLYSLKRLLVELSEQENLPNDSKETLTELERHIASNKGDVRYLSLLAELLRFRLQNYGDNKEQIGHGYQGFALRLLRHLSYVHKVSSNPDEAFNLFQKSLQAAEASFVRKAILPLIVTTWGDLLVAYEIEKQLTDLDFRTEIQRIANLFFRLIDACKNHSPAPPHVAWAQYCEDFGIPGNFEQVWTKIMELLVSLSKQTATNSVYALRRVLEDCPDNEAVRIVKARLDTKQALRKAVGQPGKFSHLWATPDEVALLEQFFEQYRIRLGNISFLIGLKFPVYAISAFHLVNLRKDRDLMANILGETLWDLDFQIGCELQFFRSKRQRFAFSREEIEAVLLELLIIKEDEKLLDMFGNVPRLGIAATVWGANVVCGDLSYRAFPDAASAFRKGELQILETIFEKALSGNAISTAHIQEASEMFDKIIFEELETGERAIGETPKASPVVTDEVNPYAPYFFLTQNFLVLLARAKLEIIKYRIDPAHEYSIPLKDETFEHLVVDPPYGMETAQEGFGPEQALPLALQSLQEAQRLAKQNGTILLTLPPEKTGTKWEKFLNLKWRFQCLSKAKELGLKFVRAYSPKKGVIGDAKGLPDEERVLCVLEKVVPPFS